MFNSTSCNSERHSSDFWERWKRWYSHSVYPCKKDTALTDPPRLWVHIVGVRPQIPPPPPSHSCHCALPQDVCVTGRPIPTHQHINSFSCQHGTQPERTWSESLSLITNSCSFVDGAWKLANTIDEARNSRCPAVSGKSLPGVWGLLLGGYVDKHIGEGSWKDQIYLEYHLVWCSAGIHNYSDFY